MWKVKVRKDTKFTERATLKIKFFSGRLPKFAPPRLPSFVIDLYHTMTLKFLLFEFKKSYAVQIIEDQVRVQKIVFWPKPILERFSKPTCYYLIVHPF